MLQRQLDPAAVGSRCPNPPTSGGMGAPLKPLCRRSSAGSGSISTPVSTPSAFAAARQMQWHEVAAPQYRLIVLADAVPCIYLTHCELCTAAQVMLIQQADRSTAPCGLKQGRWGLTGSHVGAARNHQAVNQLLPGAACWLTTSVHRLHVRNNSPHVSGRRQSLHATMSALHQDPWEHLL